MAGTSSRVLEALVLDERLDQLFTMVTFDDVAAAWCRYHESKNSAIEDKDPNWWAVNLFFTQEIFRRGDLYRALLLKIVEHASDAVLGDIGAGPLENFVSDDEDDLRWLEQECSTNPGFRKALSGVWCDTFVSEATMRRLDAAAGTPVGRPQS